MSSARQDIRKATLLEIQEYCKEQSWTSYRAKQIYEWVWQKGTTSFEDMSNLSKEMRAKLEADWDFYAPKIDLTQKSTDGTIKYRILLHDGFLVEAVLIPVAKDTRFTVCVSSQVGCSLACKFCATGQMKRSRNLDAAEIYDQVKLVNEDCMKVYDKPLTNIVFMGMGEPLLNYKEVMRSIDHITSPKGMNMAPKRITVSTAGIAKAIRRIADDKMKFNLALSLHAADDVKRDQIMPINNQNKLEVLMDALEYFHTNTNRRISYEYIAFKGFNDTPEDAKNLIKLCKKFPVHVNIIEYNPVEGLSFIKSDQDTIDEFAKMLLRAGVMTTVRRSRGKDIDAACGQLANKGGIADSQ